jgi:hypothetical protein
MKHLIDYKIFEQKQERYDATLRELSNLVEAWNTSLNQKNYESLIKFYDNSVNYHGKQKTKDEVVKSKQDFLKKNPKFFQRVSSVGGTMVDDNNFVCKFYKLFSKDYGKQVDTFLTFSKKNNQWLISEELDESTGGNSEFRDQVDDMKNLKRDPAKQAEYRKQMTPKTNYLRAAIALKMIFDMKDDFTANGESLLNCCKDTTNDNEQKARLRIVGFFNIPQSKLQEWGGSYKNMVEKGYLQNEFDSEKTKSVPQKFLWIGGKGPDDLGEFTEMFYTEFKSCMETMFATFMNDYDFKLPIQIKKSYREGTKKLGWDKYPPVAKTKFRSYPLEIQFDQKYPYIVMDTDF